MHAYAMHITTSIHAMRTICKFLGRDEVSGYSHSIRSIFGESNFPRFSAPLTRYYLLSALTP